MSIQKEPLPQVRIHYDPSPSKVNETVDIEDEDSKSKYGESTRDFAELVNLPVPSSKNFIRSSSSLQKRQQVLTKETSAFERFRRFYYRHKFELDTTLTVFLFLFDVYKIFMGSFLTVFTYQRCDILNETFRCFDQPYELFALAWNLFTFVCCFVLLGYQIHREAYFIRELYVFKDNQNTIEQFLKTQSDKYQQDVNGDGIINQVDMFNYRYGVAAKLSAVAFLLNVIFSGFSMFLYMYMGLKTLTSFISNVLLLGLLIAKSLYVVYMSEESDTVNACSSYRQEFVFFNGINVWFRHRQQTPQTNQI